jgi:hypothetical protein
MHNRNRPDLFLGEFVGPLKIVYFDLTGIRSGSEIFRFRITRVYRREQLIYFFLGQNFCHFTYLIRPVQGPALVNLTQGAKNAG